MKLSKNLKVDIIVPLEGWKCYDDCPACRFLKKAAEEGREVSSAEVEKIFAEAREENEV